MDSIKAQISTAISHLDAKIHALENVIGKKLSQIEAKVLKAFTGLDWTTDKAKLQSLDRSVKELKAQVDIEKKAGTLKPTDTTGLRKEIGEMKLVVEKYRGKGVGADTQIDFRQLEKDLTAVENAVKPVTDKTEEPKVPPTVKKKEWNTEWQVSVPKGSVARDIPIPKEERTGAIRETYAPELENIEEEVNRCIDDAQSNPKVAKHLSSYKGMLERLAGGFVKPSSDTYTLSNARNVHAGQSYKEIKENVDEALAVIETAYEKTGEEIPKSLKKHIAALDKHFQIIDRIVENAAADKPKSVAKLKVEHTELEKWSGAHISKQKEVRSKFVAERNKEILETQQKHWDKGFGSYESAPTTQKSKADRVVRSEHQMEKIVKDRKAEIKKDLTAMTASEGKVAFSIKGHKSKFAEKSGEVVAGYRKVARPGNEAYLAKIEEHIKFITNLVDEAIIEKIAEFKDLPLGQDMRLKNLQEKIEDTETVREFIPAAKEFVSFLKQNAPEDARLAQDIFDNLVLLEKLDAAGDRIESEIEGPGVI